MSSTPKKSLEMKLQVIHPLKNFNEQATVKYIGIPTRVFIGENSLFGFGCFDLYKRTILPCFSYFSPNNW